MSGMKRSIVMVGVLGMASVTSGFVVAPVNVHQRSGFAAHARHTSALRMSTLEMPLRPEEQQIGWNTAVQSVRGPEDFQSVVDSSKNKMVVLKFSADFCRACKAVGPQFQQLAENLADEAASFHEVDFGLNKSVCRSLGIKTLPHVQVYKDGKVVKEQSITPKRWGDFASWMNNLPQGGSQFSMQRGAYMEEKTD